MVTQTELKTKLRHNLDKFVLRFFQVGNRVAIIISKLGRFELSKIYWAVRFKIQRRVCGLKYVQFETPSQNRIQIKGPCQNLIKINQFLTKIVGF